MAETVAKINIACTVNGEPRRVQAYPMARLLDVLREEMHLTGTKEGCGEGECGACAVLLNGAIVNSCLVPAIEADGAEIRTIEGIASGDQLHAVQAAFLECGGAQCGICTPGMVIAAVALLERHPHPERRGNSRRACGKSLPLHRISENFRRRCARLRIGSEKGPGNR